MLRTRISLPGLCLVTGLVVGASVATGVAMATDDTAAKKAKTVKVCVTKQKAVRSATVSGGCPAGTKKQKINTKGPVGPRGPAGPGETSSLVVIPADDTLRTLGAGLTYRCRTNAGAHILVGADPNAEVRGMVARQAGGNNTATGIQRGFISTGADTFLNGDVFGSDPQTGVLEHVSFAIDFLVNEDKCEVRALRIPLA